MTLQAIKDRIKEFESTHKVEGGTHLRDGFCPTCVVIKQLRGFEQKLVNEKDRKAIAQKAQLEAITN